MKVVNLQKKHKQAFSVKGLIVYNFGFVGHVVSILITQLWSCGAGDNT